ncbi:EAL domain-containing protein [Massilia cavernae]|uniref:EAL domain-containing protein n=2 Tax=Massilia cavernae TaxID=2320864 RepID=A0A418XY50_9BURK|nr:EAL domain-containing protein [Massilia cavernae]
MEFISAGIEKLSGYPASAFTTRSSLTFGSLIHPGDRDAVSNAVYDCLSKGKSLELTYRIVDADGAVKWVWEQGAAVLDDAGQVAAIQGFMVDFTRVKEADLKLMEQGALLDKARDAIVVTDAAHRITYWNKGAERLYGWDDSEVSGQRVCDLLRGDLEAFDTALEATLAEGQWSGELSYHRRDGATVYVDSRWTLLRADERAGTVDKIMCISTDITERKRRDDQIFHMAFYDSLTGLANRTNLLDHLRRALLGSARSRKFGALMFCDFDHFKTLNDTHGHAVGDMLLQAAARRLEHSIREADLVARLGGDEFVILIPPGDESLELAASQAEAVAAKVVAAMETPFQLAGFSCTVSISIGIALICGAFHTVESALSEADSAMYQAKASGRNTYRFFDPDRQAAWTAKTELEASLRCALVNNEFVLYYQPQLDGANQLIGAEALLRWRRPDGKLLLPSEFIRAAEETSLIVDIGAWVLHTACAQLAIWQKSPETAHLTLSINLGLRQLAEASLAELVGAAIRETGADPSKLRFEVAEGLVMSDFPRVSEQMVALSRLGVRFSLDHVGAGYSSLSYLRQLPIFQLKIGHTFVRDVLADPDNAAIVRSIIALGSTLGLQVIAEGVETQGQREFLSEAGCFGYQGFLYEPAISEEHFGNFARHIH